MGSGSDDEQQERAPRGYADASFLDHLTFGWMNALLASGFKLHYGTRPFTLPTCVREVTG
jgi:hypothetical protein